jgi:hypothetical protein
MSYQKDQITAEGYHQRPNRQPNVKNKNFQNILVLSKYSNIKIHGARPTAQSKDWFLTGPPIPLSTFH